MDNSFMVGLSAQQVLRQRMDTTANNLANMTTTGFKAEHVVMRELVKRPIQAMDKPNDVAFVDAWAMQRDFSTGPIARTGNPLDAAIEGEGFFTVQTPDGVAYTRDGGFSLNDQGQIVTKTGRIVLGDAGPLTVDPERGEVQIGADGTVRQGLDDVGKLRIDAFDTPGAMEKIGDNLLKATGLAPRAPANMRVAGGFLEQSNVNPVLELTQMIEVSRAYQSISQMLVDADNLRSTSIQKLAQVR